MIVFSVALKQDHSELVYMIIDCVLFIGIFLLK
jgi:hypothetical protein